MLSVFLFSVHCAAYFYAQCCSSECLVECLSAECHSAESHGALNVLPYKLNGLFRVLFLIAKNPKVRKLTDWVVLSEALTRIIQKRCHDIKQNNI
jgi:hypothetical protein